MDQIIYRVSRVPGRRIFYVDVGNLPKIKAEQYMRDIIRDTRIRLSMTLTQEKLRMTESSESILEDFWKSHVEKVVEVLRFPHF